MSKREAEALEQKRQAEVRKIRLPKRENLEQFGLITQLVGGFHIKALCEDGTERICRIPGKMKKRIWMRLNDIVIVRLWDFQPIKADIVWRFIGVQTEHLKKRGLLTKLPV